MRLRASTMGLVVGLAACAAPASPGVTPPGEARSSLSREVASPSRADADAMRLGTIGSALAFHREFAAADKNALMAPASIQTAIGMLRAGASGATAQALDRVMGWTLPEERTLVSLNAIDAALASRSREHVEIAFANRAFIRDEPDAVRPSYLDSLALNFGAGVSLLDFRAAPEPSRLAINSWVSEQTAGHIEDLLPEGSIEPLTRLVLVNTVYLDAQWADVFDEARTRDAAFRRADGTIMTPTMNGTVQGTHASGAGWIAAELPYEGDELAMLVVMPTEGSLAELENSMDATGFEAITTSLSPAELSVSLPRFEFESSASLLDYFEREGEVSALDELSRIVPLGQESPMVTGIFHSATIGVTEDGTVATGATAVVGGLASAPPSIVFDRPFFFAIRDRETGAILFIGHVVDPSA
jgi:serpin B